MAVTFPDNGIVVVPTGSLGVYFSTTDALPDAIEVRATNTALAVTVFSDLAIISDPDSEWNYVELTGVLPFGEVYAVEVLFDSVSVHTQSVEVALPGKKRARVLRQRIYELAQTAYLADEIETEPYGNGHYPSATKRDFKGHGGLILEVGPAYIGDLTRAPGYDTQTANVTVPLNVFGGIDESEDTEEIANAFEDVAGYLLAANWRLSGFGIIQSAVTFSGATPEIADDRKSAVVRGSLTIPVRAKIG